LTQVVALFGGEVEEFFRDDAGDGVVAAVGFGNFAVAGAGEAGYWLGGVQGEGLFED
jgi:hypothetical protein